MTESKNLKLSNYSGIKLLLSDPPWSYGVDGKTKKIPQTNWKQKAGLEYSAMHDSELISMCSDIQKIVDKDSIIVQWTVGGRLDFGIKLIELWGFKFSGVLFTWVKTDQAGRPFFGMGTTTRMCCEFAIFGRRGKGLPAVDRGIPDVIMHPRGRHSEKPKIHGLLTRLFGVPTGHEIEALELFARDVTPLPGWAHWGNEVTIRPAQKELSL